MKPHSMTLLALGLLLGAGVVLGSGVVLGAEGDAEKIQGTWKVAASEDRGRKVREEELQEVRLVITKDRIVMKVGDKTVEELVYHLDPAKSPRWIDMARLSADGKPGDTVQGIYELTGDDLRICHAEKRKGERATAFETKPDSPNVVLIVLTREKP